MVCSDALEHLQSWWESHGQSLDLEGFSLLWKARGGERHDWLYAFQDCTWNFRWPQLDAAFQGAYLREQAPFLLASLGVSGYPLPTRNPLDFGDGRRRALRLLKCLQPLPSEALDTLWALALGEARSERELAQQCLLSEADWETRLLQSLSHSQAGSRERAAEWAGRLRVQAALPGLTAAVRKEKVEKARLAQMGALKQLGAPLEVYLNRAGLLSEARKTLAKGWPDGLSGVPLPELHWSGENQPVDGELLQGLLVGAVRLKNPQPSALLSSICEHFEVGPRERWAIDLLTWWIEQDTRPQYTSAEIEALLPGQVQAMASIYQQLGQPKSLAALESEVRRNLTLTVKGSAIDRKGILAVAGACGGSGLVPMVQSYLKVWYGMRAAQCKALLAMLAHLDCPEAVQYLLTVARRFRTKGIQEEAQLRLSERAQRLGWSLEDMADLSLPTGGLDEEGKLQLDYGGRTVQAELLPDLSWRLSDDQGKRLKSLPAAAAQDDNEKVKLATRTFKAAQKSIKELARSLGDRLYDAMGSGRTWNWEIWQTCLLRHPVARKLCQSLIWCARRGSDRVAFRPSDDGSLINADQQLVELTAEWSVSLAHPVGLTPAELAAWHDHLSDYVLVPPFRQLSRAAVAKPQQPPERSEFWGHMLDSFALRNRARSLGYERAPAEDGGVFYEYRKTLANSGWLVRLLFSGSALPETQHPVALDGLNFEKQGRPVSLAEVPDVLYSEAYNDLAEIAREGSGFHPDWAHQVKIS
jgi:hypothetical protein